MSDILAFKRALRDEQIKKRKLLADLHPDALLQLRNLFIKHIDLPTRCVVASYSAKSNEMNPAPIAVALQAKGHVITLPTIMPKQKDLVFRSYIPGDKLMQSSIGIWEPLPNAMAVMPDVLLVPLLAFDKRGYRLGYGGGYYDQTLTNLRSQKKILAIGIAFDGQEVPEVPTGPHDAKLDKIVTENRVLEDFLP